jgi:hypothetical protein
VERLERGILKSSVEQWRKGTERGIPNRNVEQWWKGLRGAFRTEM